MQFLYQRRWLVLFVLMMVLVIIITIGADLRLIPTRPFRIRYSDKLGHFILYGILAFLLHFAVNGRRWKINRVSIPVAVCIVAAISLLDEAHQFFIRRRSLDAMDFAADVAGILFFVWLAERLRKRIAHRHAD